MTGTPKRDQIVAIATDVLARDGLDQFVMRRIADLADMKLGNLQYYFPTRDDLLEAVVRSEFVQDLAAIDAVENSDPRGRLSEVVDALSNRWFARNGSVYLPIAVLALHNGRFERIISEIYAEFYTLMSDIVRAIDPSATEATAHQRGFLMTALLDGASLQPGRNDATIRVSLVDDLKQLAASVATGREQPYRLQ
jgi:AcrR family transcriptional regulator